MEHNAAGELENEIDAAIGANDKNEITTLKIVVNVNSFDHQDRTTAYSLTSSYPNLTNLVLDYSSFTDASVPAVFPDCRWIKSLVITDGATIIGDTAFGGCTALASVILPEGITEIGNNAFTLTAMTEFEVPKATQVLPGDAFWMCPNLTSFTVADGNSFFEASEGVLFKDGMKTLVRYPEGKSGESYTIPDSVETIGYDAFSGSSLEFIKTSDSVTSIGEFAFYDCSSLTSIDVPDGVLSIGHYAFYGCKLLTSIKIPAGVTSIEAGVFRECELLTSIDIPGSVKSIGKDAFSGCISLTSIDIPESVTSIGSSTFSDCNSLTSIIIRGQNVPTVSSFAFYNISSAAKAYVPEGKKDEYVAALKAYSSYFPDPDTNVHEIMLDVAIPATAIALDVSGEVLPATNTPISYSNKATDSVVIDGYFTALPDDPSVAITSVTDVDGNALEAGKYYPSAKATITALKAGSGTVRLHNDTGSEAEAPFVITDRTNLKQLFADIAILDEKKYTATSWQALEAAVPAAKTTYDDTNATQTDLDDAYAALDAAYKALKLNQPLTITVTDGDINAFYVGDTLTLATSDGFIPADASRFTWDADYLDLKVSSPARVTAKKVGTTTVTYTTPQGEQASLSLTILPAKEKASTPVSTNTGGSSPKTSDGVFLTLVFPILCLAFLSFTGMLWARAKRRN